MSATSLYIGHTNRQSLFNILRLQHNLYLERIACSHSDCAATNLAGDFYVCFHCVHFCCAHAPDHLLAHCRQQRHHLFLELASQRIFCLRCGQYHHSPWIDSMTLRFLQRARKRKLSLSPSQPAPPLHIAASTEPIWRHFDALRDGLAGHLRHANLGNT